MTEINNGESPQPPAEESPAFTLILQMQQQQQQQQMQQQMAMQQQIANLMSKLLSPHANDIQQGQSARPARAKIERPVIDADCSDNQWVIFQDAWRRYKQMASLTTDEEIRNELRSSCSLKINEMLFNFVGPDMLNRATEQDLMKHIKVVAVRAVHFEVYRQQFFTLKQSDGESITNFVSRLKAQAMLCAFTTESSCQDQNCHASYSSNMVKSQLIAGIRNPSHQSKVLSEMEILQTLDQLINRLLALESTERASTHLRSPFTPPQPSEVAAIGYNKKKPYSSKPDPSESNRCAGCGQPHHPKGRSSCPAWKKNCNKCKKPNHFASVCRSASTNAAIHEDEEAFELSTVNVEPF